MKEFDSKLMSPLLSLEDLREEEFGDNDRKFTPESRYRYSILTAKDGTKYFSKRLAGIDKDRDTKWAKYLEHESAWAEFAVAAGEAYPALGFTGLEALYSEPYDNAGVQRVVYPYIEADFVSEPTMTIPLQTPETIVRYAEMLKALDSFAQGWQPKQQLDDSDEHTPFNQLDKRWSEWLEVGHLYDEGFITPEMVQNAHTLVDDYSGFVTPCFQHGDFVPWHVFSVKNGNMPDQWVSFDGEHASMQKPRFYDLAYSYSRLFTASSNQVAAAEMLGQFIALGEQNQEFTADEFYVAFIPVLMTRSMGMFLDARFDGEKGNDYLEEARDLFNRCQARDLQALLQR